MIEINLALKVNWFREAAAHVALSGKGNDAITVRQKRV